MSKKIPVSLNQLKSISFLGKKQIKSTSSPYFEKAQELVRRATELGYKDVEICMEQTKKTTSNNEAVLNLPRLNESTLDQYIRAGNEGNINAQLALADWYEDEDEDEYISWLEKAGNQGNSSAQYRLGYYYDYNSYRNSSFEEFGYKWYTKAAENGNDEAQFKLGEFYSGNDDEKSIEWYAKAAAQGNRDAEKELEKWNLAEYFALIGKI